MPETLTRLDVPQAHAALRRILLRPGVPVPLLPIALWAAADAGLVLPAAFVAGVLDRDDPAVRGAAFDFVPSANVPVPALRHVGQGSIDPPHRGGCAGPPGDPSGRDELIAGLAIAPSTVVVEALGAIGDDEGIVALGRSAMRIAAFVPSVIATCATRATPPGRQAGCPPGGAARAAY